jgi:hypothetical protein
MPNVHFRRLSLSEHDDFFADGCFVVTNDLQQVIGQVINRVYTVENDEETTHDYYGAMDKDLRRKANVLLDEYADDNHDDILLALREGKIL